MLLLLLLLMLSVPHPLCCCCYYGVVWSPDLFIDPAYSVYATEVLAYNVDESDPSSVQSPVEFALLHSVYGTDCLSSFVQLKSVLLISCVFLDLFFRTLAVNSVSDFFLCHRRSETVFFKHLYCPKGISPMRNSGCFSPGKASCDRVALSNPRCIHAGCF